VFIFIFHYFYIYKNGGWSVATMSTVRRKD